MSDLSDLFLLLGFAGVVASWLKLTRAREIAVVEARRQCERNGLQLLDETVGLRAVRLRRSDGALTLERCYGFEVSTTGDDRRPAQLWMRGERLTAIRLPDTGPAVHTDQDARPDNVVALRQPDRHTLQ